MINKNIYFILGAFFFIIFTRLLPHPPNFNSSIVLAFYFPNLFGRKYILLPLLAFIASDLFIGMHKFVFFTWGSIFLISYLSNYFFNLVSRSMGIIFCCLLFFLISNFGVWLFSGYYELNFNGLIKCLYMALPFLQNSLLGNLLFALLIEYLISINSCKEKIKIINPLWKSN